MTQTVEAIQDELARRHRAAVRVVSAFVALTLLLLLLALAGVFDDALEPNPQLGGTLRIVVAIFAVGAIVYRRTKFSAMRLQDIAALRGTAGLFRTLQMTTIHVALIGGTIAVMGFVASLMTGAPSDKWLGVIALAVLFYAYPRRSAWQRVVDATEQPRADDSTAAKGTTA
ncbi:MAG: hypothetical protein LC802_18700 [Acidobacteria bacterium]|nr:hypothetical protein [Acidobacteriota bacterium]